MPQATSIVGTLGARLARWTEAYGEAMALAYGDEIWSFRRLLAQSEQCAAALRQIGVGPTTRLGLLKPNRPDWLACAFAAWRVGATLVPLNTLYRRGELAHALRSAEVEVLIADASFLRNHYRSMLAEICPRLSGAKATAEDSVPHLRSVLYSGDSSAPGEQNWDTVVEAGGPPGELPSTKTTDDAAIFFTSGSTAAPKGVVHTHASMLAAADNVGLRLGLDANDRTYGYLPLFFNGGLVGVALSTLNRGGAVLLQDVFSASEAVELMRRHHCSVFFGWPHQAEAIAQEPTFDRHAQRLRKGPGANAPWASALLADDHRCVGTWGMSETGPMAACSHHEEALEVRRASHGRAMPGLEMRIADESGAALPTGSEGELLVRGHSLMRTYYGSQPQDCFDGDGFFHTGDRARIDDDGRLTFLGRLGDIIKTAGVNVAAAEVESVVQRHPDVDSAHVVPVPHPTRGENIACFLVAHGGECDHASVLAHCSEHLAPYKVPRHLFSIHDDALPTLGSGKVDRKALRALAEERVATDMPHDES